jgi:hypothetical protein
MGKIIKNWPFSRCHGYGFYFIIFLSFHPDGACLSGNFGVLHDLLYTFLDMWLPKNAQKWAKSSKNGRFLVAMVTDLIFFIFFLFILIGLD